MNLLDTHFVLLLTARGKLEDRFLYDFEWGILALISKGITPKQFTIVTDETRANLEGKCPIIRQVSTISSCDLYDFLNSVACESLFVISSCHGSIDGVDSLSAIEPYPFTNALKANPTIKSAVVVFGQCYAGVFNYSDLTGTNIIYLGVTDIDFGFSTWQLLNGRSWAANVPVLYTFQWLKLLIDIDKDGKASIVDLYKFVTYQTNQVIRNSEKYHNRLLVEAFESSSKAIQASSDKYLKQLYQDAMQSINDYTFVRQNTWILNARIAGNLYVTA